MDSKQAVKDVLEHHGVKGMKWGVHKARGTKEVSVKVGTNSIGKASVKTTGGEGHPPHSDAVAAKVIQQKLDKSGSHALSNHEIQRLVTRQNLESQLKRKVHSGPPAVKGAKFAKEFVKTPEGRQVIKGTVKVANSSFVKKKLATAAVALAL